MGWLENRLRKRRVAPSDGDARNGTWSAADKACLQRAIDPLRANFRRRPFAFLGSEATTMLCSSKPGEVYERLTSMLSNMSIVSGVVLSAFAGAALSPLAPDDYPPAARTKVDAFNAVAAVCVEFKSSTRLQCERMRQFRRSLRLCFENSTRAIDSSKNQPNRLRFDRAREF